MAAHEDGIRQKTVDALARGLYEEASKYGLQQAEIIRFVNMLLHLSMQEHNRLTDNPQHDPTPLPATVNFHSEHSLPLSDKELSIRACNPDTDQSLLADWLDDAKGQHFLRYRLTARTLSIAQLLDKRKHLLGIIMLDDTTPIGCVAFLDHDRAQRKAELRKLIGAPEMRRKGYAKRATRLWINFGLHELKLQKIYLNTLGNNIRNIRINEQLGFSVEGILRNEVFLDGKHQDIIRMGLYGTS